MNQHMNQERGTRNVERFTPALVLRVLFGA
jgi:hypothetical protein